MLFRSAFEGNVLPPLTYENDVEPPLSSTPVLEHERVEALKQVTPNLAYPLWAMLCEHLDTADLLELGMLDSLLVFASNWAKIDQFKFNAVIDHMCARFDFDVLVKHRLPHRMFLIVERAQFKVPLDCIKEGEESSTAAATTTTTTTSSTSQSTPVVPPIATSASSSRSEEHTSELQSLE